MIERHQDYILTIPSLLAGQTLSPATLGPLDLDAPFLCRGVGLHMVPVAPSRLQTDNKSISIRIKNQAGGDLSQVLVPAPQFFNAAYGQNGMYRPVWPQLPYPPGGTIQIEITNGTAHTLTNTQVIFRGVKLFPDGAIPNPTYPAQCRALDFSYQSGKGTQVDPAIVLQSNDAIYRRIFQVDGDADFVLRGGFAGNWSSVGSGTYSAFGYTELYIQLMDATLKPYSNAPIHIDWLFGNAGGQFIAGGPQLVLGNSAPGLLIPELYMPKNTTIFFDLFRQDGPYVTATDALPVRLSIAWVGSKIYS